MDERTIEIEIHGKPFKVLAGNAALRRYRKAGGSMNALQNLDTKKGENSPDDILDALDSVALLIWANIVDKGDMTIDDLLNGVPTMDAMGEICSDLLDGVPWLGNGEAAGTESRPRSGLSQSSR